MRRVKFIIKGTARAPILSGLLMDDGKFVKINNIYYNISSISIIEKEGKDKSEFKNFLLSRKKLIENKDTKYDCDDCKRDVRVSGSRPNIVTETQTHVVWRFVCVCGRVKTVSIITKPNLN